MGTTGVRALTFDIIGTVFDAFGSLAAGVPPLAEKYGQSISADGFAAAAMGGYSSGVAAVNSHAQPWTPPDTILRNATIAALAPAIHSPATAEPDDFLDLWQALGPWPEVTGALYALHAHFELAILSNMSLATQAGLTNHSGLPFDRTLSSETVKAYKPSPAVYQMAAADLGLQPAEIMMVAAHKYDLLAAKAQGFKTAFVPRPLELGPGGQVDTTPDARFDLNVPSFTELAATLGAGPPTLAEDALPVRAAAATVKLFAGDWKVIDGAEQLLDFGSSQANANRARDVITHYGFDRVCYVGRPNPPMTYFTVGGSAPTGPTPGEDAVAFDLAKIRAEQSAGDWIVTDGAARLLDFGSSRSNALHAVALIRHYAFTHQCFVGRPHPPMTYFRK